MWSTRRADKGALVITERTLHDEAGACLATLTQTTFCRGDGGFGGGDDGPALSPRRKACRTSAATSIAPQAALLVVMSNGTASWREVARRRGHEQWHRRGARMTAWILKHTTHPPRRGRTPRAAGRHPPGPVAHPGRPVHLGADLAEIWAPCLRSARLARDDTGAWGPPFLKDGQGRDTEESAYYLSANRNKRSVEADMATPAGAALIRELATASDILVENFKVGGLAKYGLDYASRRR